MNDEKKPIRIPYMTPSPQSMHDQLKKKIPLRKKLFRPAPPWACQELDRAMTLPNMVKHDPRKATYHEAAKVLVALSKGIINYLPPEQISLMRQRMQSNFNLRWIDQFLSHRFTLGERRTLMQRLSQYRSKSHNIHANGTKGDLTKSLCSIQGYSLLMQLWYSPPRPVQTQPLIEITPEMIPYIEEAQALCKDYTQKGRADLARQIHHLREHFGKEWIWKIRKAGLEFEIGTFGTFWTGMLDYFESRGWLRRQVMNPGWLHLNSFRVKAWLHEVERRIVGEKAI